jgi:hydrogenase expression/formation protein HypE
MESPPPIALSCPIPKSDYDRIGVAHGGGGRLTQDLFERIFLPAFDNPALAEQGDGANLDLGDGRVTLTTDAYVVRPIFFPGGDIGSLSIHGTVNDLAVCGARPVAISAAFMIEEGLPVETLWRIVCSMREAVDASAEGLRIVCGDTKVIDAPGGGREPGLMITTTGVGARTVEPAPGARRIRPGDAILVSGPVGDHGMAVMSVREGLEFESPIVTDSAPLWHSIESLMAAVDVHAMRDLTRGGLSSALNELARSSGCEFELEESVIPVRPTVAAACEILGLDPLYVACEGRFVVFVGEADADRALAHLRALPATAEAAKIGEVRASTGARTQVVLQTPYGSRRPLDMLSGEQLPRIC